MNEKMKDAGKKPKTTEVASIAISKEKRYPSISLSSDILSDIKDLKMGDTIEIHGKYVVKGLREDWDNKKEIVAELEMKECMVMDGPDDYKESKRTGLGRKDYEELKKKKDEYKS